MDEAARVKDQKGMGCTLVTCLVDGDWAYIAHVGDVRCYLYDNGDFRQVTRDHSAVTDIQYIEKGEQVHKRRNVVTMGIGFPFPEDPELHQLSTHSNGKLLLCSDGLWGMVDDEEIAHVLGSDLAPREACIELVAQANNNGGKDNVTALVIQL